MPIEEVNLPFHRRWLIDPIPLESDKTLINGPGPARAVLGWTAGSSGAAVTTASLVPLSHHLAAGFDQWGHSSHTHTHTTTRPKPVIRWLKGLEDIASPPYTYPKKKKPDVKLHRTLRQQATPSLQLSASSLRLLRVGMQIDLKESGG